MGTKISEMFVSAPRATFDGTEHIPIDVAGVSGAGLISKVKDYVAAALAVGVMAAGTITTSQPHTLTQTWNAGGVTFNALLVNVTNSASAAASTLLDLQVAGSSKLAVDISGNTILGTGGSLQGGGAWRLQINSAFIFTDYLGNDYGQVRSFGFTQPSTGAYGFGSTTSGGTVDLFLYRDAAGILAQRNSTNAQTLRIYNTYTDASNYERVSMGWASNEFIINAAGAGTGSTRNIVFSANGTPKVIIRGSANREMYLYNDGNGSIVTDPVTSVYVYGAQGLQLGSSGTDGFGFSMSNGVTSGDITIGRGTRKVAFAYGDIFGDVAAATFSVVAGPAYGSATVNLVGGAITLQGGAGASGSAGAAHGGNVTIRGGDKYGTGHYGYVIMDRLPTSSAGLPSGAIWANSNVLTVVP
jgi:hypothetical protein